MNKSRFPGLVRRALRRAGEKPLYFWPPVFSLAFFLLLYGFFRFSPYGALESFLERPWSTRYYDRRGNLVQILPLEEGLRREYAGPGAMDPKVAAVFLSAEDERFYYHPGIDPLSVLRALFQNIKERRRVSGASTITMQLARIIAARPEEPRSFFTKMGEALNAFRLEARFSKKEILNLYLNSLPFGFQTEGIASAARNFFASEISLLSPAELFCLAVIPRRPAAYNPFTERGACIDAAQKLAARFARGPGAREFPLYAALEAEDWEALNPRRFRYPQHMPHLVRHVNGLLAEFRAGGKNAPPSDYVLSADLELQRFAEDLIGGYIRRHSPSRLDNGAALALDNKTGEVLAWVGSADYYNRKSSGQIDGVLVKNQMGSSMKPFLYALALERGFKPSDVLADIPSAYGGRELYIPQNFNNRFNGPVLFRTALASSLNIPAVDLLDRLGVEEYGRFLFTLGFSLDAEAAENAGLGLALGNAPVKLAEMAAGFSVFPRDGIFLPLRFDRGEEQEYSGDRVMNSDTARLVCSILSDRRARVLGFGRGTNFETPFPAMFKTGTANQYQSIVALGATPRFTVAVWMGNFTGETVVGRTGSSLPAAVVRQLLVRLQGTRREAFLEPQGWVKTPVCALSGMAPSAACPSVIEEYLPPDWAGESCSWHKLRGSSVEVKYPPEYQGWFFSQTREGTINYSASPLEIISPRDNYTFFPSSGPGTQSIPVEVIGGSEDTITVDYDTETFTVSRPFVFFLPYAPGRHSLRVRNGGETAAVYFIAE
ncbi:MAG: transglycosylase domain-containing protein [Spirochaetaceae bacterium]|nr:transglycosylase domain-containing protein [Spirochaetaceae bacterium]